MILNIKIQNIATYTNLVEINPKKLNFFYGSNGSGKTTISKLLNYNQSPDACEIKKDHNDDVKVLVYNKQFVDDNFRQSEKLKGIFTLGQDSIEQQEKLESLQKENQEKQATIDIKNNTIKGFNDDMKKSEAELMERSWKIQQEIGERFNQALVGFRKTKAKFFEGCLSAYNKLDKGSEVKLEELEVKYTAAYSKNSKIYQVFPPINVAEGAIYETSDLLAKVITGSNDSPIAQLIDVLKNSDWIRQGLNYIDHTDKKCPFCQQEVSNELKQEIKNYFDEAYKKDCANLDRLISDYETYSSKVLSHIKNVIDSDIPIINVTNLNDKYQNLANLFKLNLEALKNKRISPSNKVSLDDTKELLEKINGITESFNEAIESNNTIVRNRDYEKTECANLLWKYIALELKEDISTYKKFLQGKKTAIAKIQGQIDSLKKFIEDNKHQIKTIEDSLTSVIPTVTDINNLLVKFDFKGFSLKENEKSRGTYEIVREDGSNAKNTLSEGEYNFITFLYFYHLVYGSQEKIGITSEKIIVIDDPISSLDSNVLFIVSTLVKNILRDCRNNEKGILQTFILTHNIYFHKEITFLGNRDQYAPNEVLFGIIRKIDNISNFVECPNNPIESTYQLLWRELAEDNLSTVTSFNTMRRILEYYFKIIGTIDYEKCINEFDGQDKIICKALVSCINDGSHFISDDFVITFDYENINNYKKIFELIFEKLGHKSHYEMMTRVPN